MNKKNILIIDDNKDLAISLAAMLEENKHNVAVAHTGAEAISLFRKNEYDIALLDIKLPDMTGFDVFRALHAIQPRTKVIVMTGYRLEQVIKQVTDNGEVSIFFEPFDINQLLPPLDAANENIVVTFSSDPDITNKIVQALHNERKTTNVVRTFEDFSNRARVNHDVLILNMKHPVLYAIAIYLEFKKFARTFPTIIVINHPEGTMNRRDALNNASITGCLMKPFKIKDIISAIEVTTEKFNDAA